MTSEQRRHIPNSLMVMREEMKAHATEVRDLMQQGNRLEALETALKWIDEAVHLNSLELLPTSQMLICINDIIKQTNSEQ
jgi:hypothetical protein